MLDAVEEDIAQGGDGLIDESNKVTKKHSVAQGAQEAPQNEEDPSLLDIGTLVSDDVARVDRDNETEKLNELLQGLMLESETRSKFRRRGMFDEVDEEDIDTDSDFQP